MLRSRSPRPQPRPRRWRPPHRESVSGDARDTDTGTAAKLAGTVSWVMGSTKSVSSPSLTERLVATPTPDHPGHGGYGTSLGLPRRPRSAQAPRHHSTSIY